MRQAGIGDFPSDAPPKGTEVQEVDLLNLFRGRRSYALLKGHVIDALQPVPSKSVQTVVTSPPYWAIRDYSRCDCALQPTSQGAPQPGYASGFRSERYTSADLEGGAEAKTEPDPACPKCHGTGRDSSMDIIWDGRWDCEHEWGDEAPREKAQPRVRDDLPNPPSGWGERDVTVGAGGGRFCHHCGAWFGQFGLEPTLDLWLRHIVATFREVRRVLRDDGTVWMNLGDTYAQAGVRFSKEEGEAALRRAKERGYQNQPSGWTGRGDRGAGTIGHGLKVKDLVGQPWQAALALQADGWWLRSDIIWSKPNPMPESASDRPTRAHEYLFLLTKSSTYFYDADAIREPNRTAPIVRARGENEASLDTGRKWHPSAQEEWNPAGKNRRSVWEIPTQAFADAHFATFPEALVEPAILAGTPEKGSCKACGAPIRRISEDVGEATTARVKDVSSMDEGTRHLRFGRTSERLTTGWRRTCRHSSSSTVPAIVLDPFNGSGTTGVVALRLGRRYIGVDVKPEYLEMAESRLRRFPIRLDAFEEAPN